MRRGCFSQQVQSVINCPTVRLSTMMDEMAGWESIQMDYVLDFYQAPINSMMCIFIHHKDFM